MERLDRLVFTHRRLLAAVCAGLAVLLTITALDDGASTRQVVVVRGDLDAGTVLTAEHLTTQEVPIDAVPTGVLTSASDAVGRALAGPVRDGETMTDRRVVDARDLSGFGIDDPALATVRVTDRAVLGALHVGARVDVVALDPHGEAEPSVIARAVAVAALPTGQDDGGGDVVGLVAPNEVAVALAAAGLGSGLTLIAS
ncbi:MAG: SAF domain-containing protein [Aeromicrobium sp.]|uniref:SAF domain-containing protein n=1 Tax=Aeromicrobium sp. TaxID=1871063 RepID=UPI002633F64B|nr:SAF domain-containing protein [Aeromicrobium sp.]MDF1705917.1 SAF domain-containing protein [Aeromicrobium sp.]